MGAVLPMPTGKKVAELAINTLLGLIATLAVLFGTGAWSLKENASDHAADVSVIMEMQARTLDVVCDMAGNRTKRACTEPRPELRKP